MCRAQLQVLPSAPEDQRTNNVERSWQTLSHRMCAMMLNQDNLAKDMWFAFLLAACTYDNAVCHGDATATPPSSCVDGSPTSNTTQSFTHQLAMCPSTGHRKVLKALRALVLPCAPCHIICPPCAA
jgi:hypothetical protein